MVLDTQTLDLTDEQERLDDDLDALADRAAEADDAEMAILEQRATELETYLSGVAWALSEFGEDATVTIGALDTGEMARVTDRTLDAKGEIVGRGSDPSVDGASENFYVAMGIREAPFIDEGAGFEARATAVQGLHPNFTKYLRNRIDDLSTPEADLGNSFRERVAKRTSGSE
jgi:hypothetical protein